MLPPLCFGWQWLRLPGWNLFSVEPGQTNLVLRAQYCPAFIFDDPDSSGRLQLIENENSNRLQFRYSDNTVIAIDQLQREMVMVFDRDRLAEVHDHAAHQLVHAGPENRRQSSLHPGEKACRSTARLKKYCPKYCPPPSPSELTALFCWSHPPGSNRRPADYETAVRLKINHIAFIEPRIWRYRPLSF